LKSSCEENSGCELKNVLEAVSAVVKASKSSEVEYSLIKLYLAFRY
jgi:hypothetical protein